MWKIDDDGNVVEVNRYCRHCRYFSPTGDKVVVNKEYYEAELQNDLGPMPQSIYNDAVLVEAGVCLRYPPVGNQWAIVDETDWCGEFVARKDLK